MIRFSSHPLARFAFCLVLTLAVGFFSAESYAEVINDSSPNGVTSSGSGADFFGEKATDTTFVGGASFSFNVITASTVPNGAVIGRDLPIIDSWDYAIAANAGEAFDAASISFSGTAMAFANNSASDFLTFELFINNELTARDTVVLEPSVNSAGSPFHVKSGSQGNDNNSNSQAAGGDFATAGLDFTLSLSASDIATLAGIDITSVSLVATPGNFGGGIEEFAVTGTLEGNSIPEPASLALMGLGSMLMLSRRSYK